MIYAAVISTDNATLKIISVAWKVHRKGTANSHYKTTSSLFIHAVVLSAMFWKVKQNKALVVQSLMAFAALIPDV